MLLDKIAIVTGASRGIGKAIASRLAKEGANIVIADVDTDEGEKVAQAVRKINRECLVTKCDVRNAQEVEDMVKKTIQRFGHIDILVNNAGVSSMAPMVDLEEKDWYLNMDINAKGTFLCSRAAARRMIKQKSGKIINNASLAAKRGARFLAHYSASKFAVLGLTYTMAIELASHNITVNAVCPGVVETDMIRREWKWEGDIRGVSPRRARDEDLAEIPLGRLCQPEDVAGVIAFLASKDADYLTGQAINVNGGMEVH